MRFVVLTFLGCLISIIPAHATPITRDAANAYFENCTAQPSNGLSSESQQHLCACTAAKMMERMTVEEVQAMSQQSEAGRRAMNYMLVKVYAPCMSYPARDHYYNNCITNPKTTILGGDPKKVCNCMATEVANYLGSSGPEIFADILKRNPTITDPMTALTSDSKFERFAQSKLIGCINRH